MPPTLTLRLRRDVLAADWTLSILTVDYGDGRGPLDFGFACEDTDRDLSNTDPITKIKATKIAHRTAIPVGRYRIRTTWSPKYRRMMPLVCNVPGWSGVRLHSGNDADDSSGCILPGLARDAAEGTVSKSRSACAWLYAEIAKVEEGGGQCWLEVTRGT